MARVHKNVVTTHDAIFHNILDLLTTPLADIPGVMGGTSLTPCQVWDFLGMPLTDICGNTFGFTKQQVAHNDAVLRRLNPKLVRGIQLTVELKRMLNLSPDLGFDPTERPVTWELFRFVVPRPAKGIWIRRRGQRLTPQETREVFGRFRGSLHMVVDNACEALYELARKAPAQAERIAQELIRLGY
jgi:hypothetical protein